MAKKENVVHIKDLDFHWATFEEGVDGEHVSFVLGKDYINHMHNGHFHLKPEEVKELMLMFRRILKV